MKNLVKILFISPLFLLNSCYSFTGNSLNNGEQTIQIKTFPNETASNPDLSQQFTTALQNRFLQRTRLKGTDSNPDILIEGEITGYTISSTTISSNTVTTQAGTIQAANNQLTITVKVHYENKKDSKASFDRTYSDQAIFPSETPIQTIESSQVPVVNDRIINKIFNDIVANW